MHNITAEDIRLLRSLLGISQKELAEKIGVSIRTISNYEIGGVIPANKQKLLSNMLVDERTKIANYQGSIAGNIGRDNINNLRGVYNKGAIGGDVLTGDNIINAHEKDQQIMLLENEIKHLNELLAEKERLIQTLLKK